MIDRNATLTQILEQIKKMVNIVDNENISLELQKAIIQAQNILNDSQREQILIDSNKKPGHKIWIDGNYKFIYDPIYSKPLLTELEEIGSNLKYDDVEEIGSLGNFQGRNIVELD